jgi:hypothetical protein
LAVDATRVIAEAQREGLASFYLPWTIKRLEGLRRNLLTRHEERVMRSHTTSVSDMLKPRAAKVAEPYVSPLSHRP